MELKEKNAILNARMEQQLEGRVFAILTSLLLLVIFNAQSTWQQTQSVLVMEFVIGVQKKVEHARVKRIGMVLGVIFLVLTQFVNPAENKIPNATKLPANANV